jgi:hypothetical protein
LTAVTVTNSEQLYYAAQSGYKPVPESGSEAAAVYDYASDVLKQIVSDGMTEVEKAHAIYDWIMWRVEYDHAVLSVSKLESAVKYKAYYLEGVFNSSRPYAVCDGISKAYALMANMENLECIRVAGIAGAENDVAKWAGHAWNKIKINGEWYVVDATWGDELIQFKGKAKSYSYYEMPFHRFFLLTDFEAERTRAEDQPNNYPRTSVNPYNWYADEFDYDGGKLSFYVDSPDYVNLSAKLAAYMIGERAAVLSTPQPDRYEIAPGGAGTVTASEYIAFDIKIGKNFAQYFTGTRGDTNPIIRAFNASGFALDPLLNEGVKCFYLAERSAFDGLYLFVIIAL